MNRSIVRRSLTVLAGLVLCLWPLAAGAHPAASTTRSAAEVAWAFAHNGFQVDAGIYWASAGVTTFFVRDSQSVACDHVTPVGGERVLLVRVYADAEAARAAYLRAAADEQALLGSTFQMNGASGLGPRLVDGYGPSLWRANVAVIQSTEHELRRLDSLQASREYGAAMEADSTFALRSLAPHSGFIVDPDFRGVLDALMPPES